MTAFWIFCVQAFYIYLRGAQTLNIVGRRYWSAAGVSLLLGLCGLFLVGSIARAAILGAHWTTWAAFLIAGPAGICTSIWVGGRRGK